MELRNLAVFAIIFMTANSERVIVKLASGGTTRPLLLQPLGHHHQPEHGQEEQPAPVAAGQVQSPTQPAPHKPHQPAPVAEGQAQSHTQPAPHKPHQPAPVAEGQVQSHTQPDPHNPHQPAPVAAWQVQSPTQPAPQNLHQPEHSQEEQPTLVAEGQSQSHTQPVSQNLHQPAPVAEGQVQSHTQAASHNLPLDQHSTNISDSEAVLNDTNKNVNSADSGAGTEGTNSTGNNPRQQRNTNSSEPEVNTDSTTTEAVSGSSNSTHQPSAAATTTAPSTAHSTTPTPTAVPTLPPPATPAPCHQSCLAALNSTRLYSNNSLVLSQGSDLTLICELQQTPSFYIENLLWLFHPVNSPEGQCSLTAQEFLPSCPGFTMITNTDDQNSTFRRAIITMSDLRQNHTGQYICQVQVRCCADNQQHTMTQELLRPVSVEVWRADYTRDLAVAGSVAAALLLLLAVLTYYAHTRTRLTYISIDDQIRDTKPSAVLHMPLVDDQDGDSFYDSTSDDQDVEP